MKEYELSGAEPACVRHKAVVLNLHWPDLVCFMIV